MRFPKINNNTSLIIYKLFGDALFLLLAFFFLALVADGLIPGIISDHISFLKMTLLLSLNLAVLYALGKYSKIKIELSGEKNNKKTALFFSIMAILLIFNSLLKLNLYLAVFILLASSIAFYFLYENFFEK